MKDFNQRLAVALALMGAGVAGFVSMYVGALVGTALVRALVAGISLFVLGKIIAGALNLGKQTPVAYNRHQQHKEGEK